MRLIVIPGGTINPRPDGYDMQGVILFPFITKPLLQLKSIAVHALMKSINPRSHPNGLQCPLRSGVSDMVK